MNGLEQVILKKVIYLVEHRYDTGEMGKFDAELRDDIHCIFLRMKKEIYTDEFPHREFKWPNTWIDAFKIRWFPKWLLKHFPAMETRITVTAQTIYPSIAPRLPDYENYFRMYVKESVTAYRPRTERT